MNEAQRSANRAWRRRNRYRLFLIRSASLFRTAGGLPEHARFVQTCNTRNCDSFVYRPDRFCSSCLSYLCADEKLEFPALIYTVFRNPSGWGHRGTSRPEMLVSGYDTVDVLAWTLRDADPDLFSEYA